MEQGSKLVSCPRSQTAGEWESQGHGNSNSRSPGMVSPCSMPGTVMGVGLEVEKKSQARSKCFIGATLGILSGILCRGED